MGCPYWSTGASPLEAFMGGKKNGTVGFYSGMRNPQSGKGSLSTPVFRLSAFALSILLHRFVHHVSRRYQRSSLREEYRAEFLAYGIEFGIPFFRCRVVRYDSVFETRSLEKFLQFLDFVLRSDYRFEFGKLDCPLEFRLDVGTREFPRLLVDVEKFLCILFRESVSDSVGVPFRAL